MTGLGLGVGTFGLFAAWMLVVQWRNRMQWLDRLLRIIDPSAIRLFESLDTLGDYLERLALGTGPEITSGKNNSMHPNSEATVLTLKCGLERVRQSSYDPAIRYVGEKPTIISSGFNNDFWEVKLAVGKSSTIIEALTFGYNGYQYVENVAWIIEPPHFSRLLKLRQQRQVLEQAAASGHERSVESPIIKPMGDTKPKADSLHKKQTRKHFTESGKSESGSENNQWTIRSGGW